MPITLSEIWTVAGILIILNIGALTWRVSQTAHLPERGPIPWLLPADTISLIAIAVTFLGAFVGPLVGIKNLTIPKVALGISIILSGGYPVALVIHYALYPGGPRAARQERIAVGLIFLVALLFLVLSLW
jgi:hypothetical protein